MFMKLAEGTVAASLLLLAAGRGRVVLILSTLLLGAAGAFGFSVALPPHDRSLVAVVPLVQLLMSVLTPFTTASLTHDLRFRSGAPAGHTGSTVVGRLWSRWVAAALYGVVIGAYGAAISALALALVGAGEPSTVAWSGAAAVIIGSLLIQLIPVGVGCAAGLLVPRIVLACLATIVVPLGVTALLRAVDANGIAGWVTPLGAAEGLLPGPVGDDDLLRWLTAALLWVVLPNLFAARRTRLPRQGSAVSAPPIGSQNPQRRRRVGHGRAKRAAAAAAVRCGIPSERAANAKRQPRR